MGQKGACMPMTKRDNQTDKKKGGGQRKGKERHTHANAHALNPKSLCCTTPHRVGGRIAAIIFQGMLMTCIATASLPEPLA